MAGDLWGLWLGGVVGDDDLDLARDALGGLTERGDARRRPPVGIGSGFVAVLVSPLIAGMVADKTIRAGAPGGRGGQSGAVGM